MQVTSTPSAEARIGHVRLANIYTAYRDAVTGRIRTILGTPPYTGPRAILGLS